MMPEPRHLIFLFVDHYEPDSAENRITATAFLDLVEDPHKILVRFRHARKEEIGSVLVNGKNWPHFDPVKGDVDVTSLRGKVEIQVEY